MMPAQPDQNEQPSGLRKSGDILDLQALRAACGDDGAQELLTIFLDSTEELFDQMDAALAARDGKQLKAGAHEMKGACGSVGAVDMASISRQIEQSALAEDWHQAELLLGTLKSSFVTVHDFCLRVLGR